MGRGGLLSCGGKVPKDGHSVPPPQDFILRLHKPNPTTGRSQPSTTPSADPSALEVPSPRASKVHLMTRTRSVFLLTAVAILAAALLLATRSHRVGADPPRQSLTQQANELRALARSEYLAHRGAWPAALADKYADAVRQGILDGVKRPLSAAKMAELRALISHDAREISQQPNVEEFHALEAPLTRSILADAAVRPIPTRDEREQIHIQIRKLGELLEPRVTEVVRKPIEGSARAQGLQVDFPASVAADLRAEFEVSCLREIDEPWSLAFKRPFTAAEFAAVQTIFLSRTGDRARLDYFVARRFRDAGDAERCYKAAAGVVRTALLSSTINGYAAARKPYPKSLQEAIRKASAAERRYHGHH